MSKNNSENQNHEEESSQSEFMDSSQNSSFNNTYATTQSSIDDSLTGSSQSQSEQDQLSDASNRNFQSFKPNENLTANMIHFHSNNVHQQNLQIPDQTFFYVLISCSIVVLLAGVIISFKNVNGKNKEVSCDEFLLLKTKYGNQDDALWNHFQGGVESVWNSKPTKPSVIMLLYDEHNDISNLVRDLGDMSQKCMGTKKSPLVLTADNFKTAQIQRDYGEAIEVFKLPLLESGVMIVKNFNEIPPLTAQAFHTICDSETPFVERAVIILTMPIESRKYENDSKSSTYKAETVLRNLWKKSLKADIMDPLITRVTDVVLFLK